MIIEALDFGSNTLKCLIADKRERDFSCLKDIRIPFRLSSYFTSNNYISNFGQDKAIDTLYELQMDLALDYTIEEIRAVGTETFRKAKNKRDFVKRLYQKTGIELNILSPLQEAKLEWKGVLSGLQNSMLPITVFDSGGASTEIISGINGNLLSSESYPIGALTLTQKFVHSDPISTQDFNNLVTYISSVLPATIDPKDILIGTGGGVFVGACVASKGQITNPEEANGYEITLPELNRQIQLYKETNLIQRDNIPGMEKGRADIMLAAVLIFAALLKASGKDKFSVSTRGLRHGLLTVPKWYVSNIKIC